MPSPELLQLRAHAAPFIGLPHGCADASRILADDAICRTRPDNPRLSERHSVVPRIRKVIDIDFSTDTLVVTVTDCALFDLSSGADPASGRKQAHRHDSRERPGLLPAPGGAFRFISKLLKLNVTVPGSVEVILLSRGTADDSLHLFQSLEHYGLAVTRAAFTAGACPNRYVRAFGTHLFLSGTPEEVRLALAQGIAAATMMPATSGQPDDGVLRVAFDGDAVLFSDEAERVYAESGLAAFEASEVSQRLRPLAAGPLCGFLLRLQALQARQAGLADARPCLRTALVTARAATVHERVIRTLRTWGAHVDEVLFLGGMDKGPFLSGFGADLFFDDRQHNCTMAAHHVPAAHVPYGIRNQTTPSGQVASGAAALVPA